MISRNLSQEHLLLHPHKNILTYIQIHKQTLPTAFLPSPLPLLSPLMLSIFPYIFQGEAAVIVPLMTIN